jgi:hypothetical protein
MNRHAQHGLDTLLAVVHKRDVMTANKILAGGIHR